MADTQNEAPEASEETPKKGGGIFGLIKVVAIISMVVLVEVVAASVIIPSAQQTESTARQLAAAEQGEITNTEEGATEEEADPLEDFDTVEVELGRFNVTRYNPENDTTLVVDFELYGVVLAGDQGDFESQYEKNKVRLREQVIVTLGGAESTDLTDSQLGLLKRRILEKTNRALSKPLVQEVLFSKFNFVER